MNRVAFLRPVRTPEPDRTYVEVPKAARDLIAELEAKVRAISTICSGSFTTASKRAELPLLLAEAQVLASKAGGVL